MPDEAKAKEQLSTELHDLHEQHAESDGGKAKHKLLLEEWELCFDLVPDMVCIASADGYFQKINKEWERALGYSLDELMSMPFAELIHPDDREATLNEIQRQLAGNATIHFINRYRAKDGSYRWFDWNALPAVDGNLLYAAARDITEHKRAEEALRNSEEKYRELVENANSIILRMDKMGNVTFFNEFAQRFFGYSEEEILGKSTIGTIVPPVESSTGRDLQWMIEDIGKNPDRYSVNINENMRRDGERVWIAWTNRPILNERGEVSATLCIGNDITDRCRAELKLAEAHRRVATILESITDAFVTLDRHWLFTYVNTEAERVLGVQREDLLGRILWEVFPLTVGTELERHYRRVMETGVAAELEYYHTPADESSNKWIALKVYPTEDGGLSVFFRDITGRKQSEEARALLAAVIEQADENVLITDQHRTIYYINPAFERSSGYRCAELKGKALKVLRSDRHDEAFYREMKEILDRGDVWDGIILNKGKDGTNFEIEGTISPLRDSAGTITHYVAVGRNMSRFRKLERELRQAHKMEALGTLAGGIAHDFNNILTAIIGFTEMALHKAQDDEPLRHNLEYVLQSSRRATDLVKQILTFSRQTEQEHKPVQVAYIVKEVLKLLRSSLPTTIEIRKQIEVDPSGGMVLADPTQIHQVLMNLCTNAAHAMRTQGGVLSVSLSEVDAASLVVVRPRGLRPGPYLRLTVSDTGHGMDSATMERIFDPYFTTKGLGEGTGLGLAVVQGIVQSHGGAVIVYSEPGQGTTFHVFLPRIEEMILSEAHAVEALPTGRERILLVDDERCLVEMGRQMLESLGYSVVAKTSSVEALETFRTRAETIDVVITDMTMPNLTGRDLAKELLSIRPGIPIILCTGFSDLIDAKESQEMGIRELIMKPYSMSRLAEAIRRALDEPQRL